MPRLFGILMTVFFTVPAFGELKVIESPENPTFTTYQLTVTPAPEPDPVFTHRLVLQDIDLLEGNAASYYYRAMMHLRSNSTRVIKEFGDETFYNWMVPEMTPLAKLPIEDAKRAIAVLDLEAVNRATRTRNCDWGLDISSLRGRDVFSYWLEECQQSREISRALSVQTRVALAERDFVAALDALRQNIRLGGDTARIPVLVSGLVGIAEIGITSVNLAEFIAQPGSPNLYWALAELPDPIVDLRPAVRAESEVGWKLTPILKDAETAQRTAEEWNAQWQSLASSGLRDLMNDPPTTLKSGEWGMAALGFSGFTHAKQQLLAWGFDQAKVEAMAVGQVLAVYTARVYQHYADLQERTWYVSWPEAQRMLAEAEKVRTSEAVWNNPQRELFPIASELLPAMRATRIAHEKSRRQIAALRVIEALRMHAAEHDGQLPATLAEVSCVPVPDNPATGEPFVYQLDGATAVLELPASDGLTISARYEIRVAEEIMEPQMDADERR